MVPGIHKLEPTTIRILKGWAVWCAVSPGDLKPETYNLFQCGGEVLAVEDYASCSLLVAPCSLRLSGPQQNFN